MSQGMHHHSSTLPDCVARLNKLAETTGARFFIISSWIESFQNNNEGLRKLLERRGFHTNLIEGYRDYGVVKEEGIKLVLDRMPEITAFAIVDDSHDVVSDSLLKTKHVRPMSLRGITDADAQQITALLS